MGVSEGVYKMRELGDLAFQAGDLLVLADFFSLPASQLLPSKDVLEGKFG